MVYSMLPAIAEAYDLDDDGRAWLVWLNGNTQNVVSSLLLLEAAPDASRWRDAVDFWNEHFKQLEWDTDRRHQKSKFGVATEDWAMDFAGSSGWAEASMFGWEDCWKFSKSQPYMGRLSAWSMMEYARILLPGIPDIGSWMLEDKSGSQSHRNGLAFVKGYDSVYWEADTADMLGIVEELDTFGDDLLAEARGRNYILGEDYLMTGTDVDDIPNLNVSYLTMESALCTYKSWHKPNRRYPNCYADMMYNRIKKAETRFGRTFDLLWDIRQRDLPVYLRLEDCEYDQGLAPVKQNWYRETGEIPLLWHEFPDMEISGYELKSQMGGEYGLRKDPSWASAV
jgi:hypothetical protein